MARVRDTLQNQLLSHCSDESLVRVNGHPTERLPNTLSISFKDVVGPKLLASISDKVSFFPFPFSGPSHVLPKVVASAGSACHSNQVKPSYVLEAMQVINPG